MSPFIRDGDVITVAPIRSQGGARAAVVGQIVAFTSPAGQRLVVHRIVGRHGSDFLIHGDNLSGPVAETVHPNNILGRVVRIERGTKHVWLGLGPERHVIAVLSRAGLLLPIRSRAAVLRRFFRKRLYGNN